MKSFEIMQNDQNQRLDKFLQKAVPLLPKALMYKYIRLKRIKVNGKKSEISYRLQLGDKLELYINDEFLAQNNEKSFLTVSTKFGIIYEDENILLVDKPVGLVVHEDNENTIDTLINRVLHYLYDKNEYSPENESSFIPALCNRIDRNTAGIVIVAKNAESLRILNAKIRERELKKLYLCVVSGQLKDNVTVLVNYQIKNESDNTVTVFDSPRAGAKTMQTKYTVLSRTNENSLVEVELLTGRTHQIRAVMAHLGHPLIGDGKYGSNKVNSKYKQKFQLLYSYKLQFNFKDEQEHLLSYLNHKEFTAKNVWFQDQFKELF